MRTNRAAPDRRPAGRRMRELGALLALAACGLALGGCSSGDVAGGSSEETNARVLCLLVDTDGRPVTDANVYVRPAAFAPDPADTGTQALAAVIEFDGAYRFGELDEGEYLIEALALRPDGGTIGAAIDVTIADSDSHYVIGPDTLHPTGTLQGTIDTERHADASAAVVVTGLGRTAAVGADGAFVLPNVPAYPSYEVTITLRTAQTESRTLSAVAVAPATAVDIGEVAFESDFVRDTLAVRAVLDSNQLLTVGAITVVDTAGGRIVALSLPARGIQSLPSPVGELTRLTTLDLRYNTLTALPQSLAGCVRLDNVNVDNNRFTAFPTALFACSTISSLSLDNNAIDSIPAGIASMRNLQTLDMWSNRLTALPDELFTLPRLTGVTFYNNELTTLPDGVGECRSLRNLAVSHNRIAALPQALCALTELRELHLHNNLLDSLPSCIGDMRDIVTLELQHNDLSGLPSSFTRLAYLGELNVTANQLCAGIDSTLSAFLDNRQPGWDTLQVCP
ncbi:MAG: hypothetical protein GF331_21795 [Chitinivibrionales bacterium]|nr:hypothetical protein [Chitinivibrionales bacterium]